MYAMAHFVSWGAHRSGDRAVGMAKSHHQVREAQWVEYLALRLLERHAFLLPQFEESLREDGREW